MPRPSARRRAVDPARRAAFDALRMVHAEQAYANKVAADAKKDGLAATAKADHVQLQTAPNVAQTGFLPGLADASKLLSAAFSAAKNASPQVANTGDGFAIFQVQSITPAHAPDFAAYKDHVLSDYRTQQTPVLLQQKATQRLQWVPGGILPWWELSLEEKSPSNSSKKRSKGIFDSSACAALVLCRMSRMALGCSAGGRGFSARLLAGFCGV